MEPSHLHHHHHMSVSVSVDPGDSCRFPQWSVPETRDFLMIRAELDPTFMETKRNKVLWEVISTKMKEMRGYNRTPDQCKSKWKNLVTRYKGFETTMEQEASGGMMRQHEFPFYNELQAIFTGRMQRMLWMEAAAEEEEEEEQEGGSSKKRSSSVMMQQYLSSDDEDDNKDESTHHHHHHVEKLLGNKKKKKKKKISTNNINKDSSTTSTSILHQGVNLKEILEELMKQQMQIEMQWMKLYESKEEERRMREMEWRQKMEALENDKIMFDQRWREREEQTRIKEETRSEKRDALITLLLNKLA